MIIPAASRAPLTTIPRTTFFDEWHFGPERMHGSFWAVIRCLHWHSSVFFSFFRLTHKGVILFSASSRADGGLATPQIHRSTSGAGTWAFFSALLHDGEDKKRDDSDGKGASQSCVRQEALEPVRVERKRGTRGPRKFSARGATEPENHFRFATR